MVKVKTDYEKFLESKKFSCTFDGISVNESELNPKLFQFQKDIVRWALKKGRACIWADCGLGKSFMQLEWAKFIGGKVLILAPLAVAQQTILEGKKLGIDVEYQKTYKETDCKIIITNYERLDNFPPEKFEGIVLDESSILKSLDGKLKQQIIESFKNTKYKLACTATPAPNDFMEIGNHAEFIGVMNHNEMLSMFFVHDGGETSKWRLKGHAEKKFWEWLTSWAVMIRKPSDLGYSDEGFDLPKLHFHEIVVNATKPISGSLFQLEAETLQERIVARRESVNERAEKAIEIINGSEDTWIVWCNLNSESELLKKSGCVEVKGSDKAETKEDRLIKFSKGEIQKLVSKPSICGFGMNFQVCHNVVFVGLSDSYEQFYQAIRRCWRFGQEKEVHCYIVISETEGNVLKNIKRKEEDSERMLNEMVKNMKDLNKAEIHSGEVKKETDYKTGKDSGKNWTTHLGDCVDVLKSFNDESIDFSVFSPPFASLYTYSDSLRDMGNTKNENDFYTQFQFMVKELHRVLKAGRLVSFHCMNLPTTKSKHGEIGIQDFRGDLIRLFINEGFIYHSEVVIWKDPVIAMQRTKALGLLHKQLKKDSCMSRQGIPDYLVTMRKAGENKERVEHTNEDFPVEVWQQIASPIWMDINPSDTLQHRSVREEQDERHICPLQLEVIRRALKLWTNPNDLVLSPFMGIGSEGYVALEQGRRFVGIELKESYYNQAVDNLKLKESDLTKGNLFE